MFSDIDAGSLLSDITSSTLRVPTLLSKTIVVGAKKHNSVPNRVIELELKCPVQTPKLWA